MSGLKETFIKRHIVERTNQAEIRLEEESEKMESCRKNSCIYTMTYSVERVIRTETDMRTE